MTSKPEPADAIPQDDATAAADEGSAGDSVSGPVVPDERLLAAHDLALAALREITPDATIGDAAGYSVEPDGVVSLRFGNRMPGYPGWFWTVSLARLADAEPTVLEAELLPGETALLAPDWVPWAERLADYQAQQAALAEALADQAADDEDLIDDDRDLIDDDRDLVDDDLDEDDLGVDDLEDADDFDEDGSSILHSGDVDGVDIDELDPSAEDLADHED